jgi:hypothetical protein
MDETEKADHRMRAFEQLTALRETLSNIDPHFSLQTHYVDEFHAALDHLRDAGENVEEFRIPEDWIERNEPNMSPLAQASRSRRTNPIPRSRPTIRAHYLQTRVNAVRGYFTLKAAVETEARKTGETLRRMIGFETPNT